MRPLHNYPTLSQNLLYFWLSYARKLVMVISGGVFNLFDAVLEWHSLDDLGEVA
jgi:hypothetical protein